jgi:hypothetical protein
MSSSASRLRSQLLCSEAARFRACSGAGASAGLAAPGMRTGVPAASCSGLPGRIRRGRRRCSPPGGASSGCVEPGSEPGAEPGSEPGAESGGEPGGEPAGCARRSRRGRPVRCGRLSRAGSPSGTARPPSDWARTTSATSVAGMPDVPPGQDAAPASDSAAGNCRFSRAAPRSTESPSARSADAAMRLSWSTTTALVPRYAEGISSTWMPCRAASRPATKRPSRSASARSKSGGLASCPLISLSWSGAMPRPRSSTSIAKPLATRSARTSTRVAEGENRVAFSISSASRWIRSVTADAATASSASVATVTRL